MELFGRCMKSESLGVIHGRNGCGKTETLKYLARNSVRAGLAGESLIIAAATWKAKPAALKTFSRIWALEGQCWRMEALFPFRWR